MSAAQVGKTLKELESWNEVIKAKENGVDIHAAPIKTHKLDIAGSAEHQFGQGAHAGHRRPDIEAGSGSARPEFPLQAELRAPLQAGIRSKFDLINRKLSD